MKKALNIIFDGPPGQDAPGFVECETDDGKSINAGKWIQRGNYWVLRITSLPSSPSPSPSPSPSIKEYGKLMDMIRKDMADDATNFDGKPFTGKTVAQYFGNQGAAIAALARTMKLIIKEINTND